MKKGFTLVELLVVIAILSILSTLGVANFQTARLKARDLAKKSDLQAVAKSVEAYLSDHKRYPDTADLTWGQSLVDANGTIYIAKLPDNPNNQYAYVSNGTTYTLYTVLENDQDPAIINDLTVDCGSVKCNYKITSTNQ